MTDIESSFEEDDELKPLAPIGPRIRTTSDPPIPSWRRICYGFGSVPKASMTVVVSVYFTPFLLEVVGLPAGHVTVVVFGARFLDAFSDIAVGYGLSKINLRFGKYRPWLLIATPPVAVLYVLLFYVPPISSVPWKTAYYLFAYWFWAMSETCFVVPYASMTLAASNSQKERDKMTGFRMGAELLGSILGLLVHAVTLLALGANVIPKCDDTSIKALDQSLEEVQIKKERAYMATALVLSIIQLICGTVVYFSVEEIYHLHTDGMSVRRLLGHYYKLLQFKPFVRVALIFLLLSVAVSTVSGNYQLYFTYALQEQTVFPYYVVLLYFSALFASLVWQQFFLPKLGKKTSATISSIPLMVMLWYHLFLNADLGGLLVLAVCLGLCLGGIYIVPNSMVPDIIAAYSLTHGHGKEPLFYTLTGFLDKLGIGISLGASALVLKLVGYTNNDPCAIQEPWVGDSLRIMISCVPLMALLLVLVLLWDYPINEIARARMRQRIKDSMTSLTKYGSLNHNRRSASMSAADPAEANGLVRDPFQPPVNRRFSEAALSSGRSPAGKFRLISD